MKFYLFIIASAVFAAQALASVTMDWVTVGNPGNGADPLTGYGSVAYEYKIGKYEVTNAQYGAFLNAAAKIDSYELYHPYMSYHGITQEGSSGSFTYKVITTLANQPVVFISWFDAARFANWMANGQGNGDTETGSYLLNGNNSGIIMANAGAQVYIPTENEWYKAAYYNGVQSTYSLYPNGQNTISKLDANYGNDNFTMPWIMDVNTYSNDPSAYGTFDQGGNVWEWNDASINESRGLRGGSWYFGNDDMLLSSFSTSGDPSMEGDSAIFGFRVASAIPEPTSLLLTMLAGGVMLARRKR